MSSYSSVRKRGMAGASLFCIAYFLYFLPMPNLRIFAGLLGLAGLYVVYSTFKDTSWIFHNRSIYRNFLIGSVVSYAVAERVSQVISFYGVTNPNGLPQSLYLTSIILLYAASLFSASSSSGRSTCCQVPPESSSSGCPP